MISEEEKAELKRRENFSVFPGSFIPSRISREEFAKLRENWQYKIVVRNDIGIEKPDIHKRGSDLDDMFLKIREICRCISSISDKELRMMIIKREIDLYLFIPELEERRGL